MAAIMSIMILTLLISLTYETEANQYDRKNVLSPYILVGMHDPLNCAQHKVFQSFVVLFFVLQTQSKTIFWLM